MIVSLLQTNVVIWVIFLGIHHLLKEDVEARRPIPIIVLGIPAVYLVVSTPIYIIIGIWS